MAKLLPIRAREWKEIIANDLLTQLKGFKFAPTLVLVSQKIERDDESKYFTHLINKNVVDDVFDQFILQLNCNYSFKHTKMFRKRFRLDY